MKMGFVCVFAGQRRALHFQYELSSTELVAKAIDNLLNDWSKIVYLYSLVHDFSEQYKNGERFFFLCTFL